MDNTSSESTAGSFHLSTSSSIKRVRVSHPHAPLYPSNDTQYIISHSGGPGEGLLFEIMSSLKQALLLSSSSSNTNRSSGPQNWSKLCLKSALAIYCFLSFVVFSFDLYAHAPIAGVDPDISSAFDDASMAQRLSRLFMLPSSDYLAVDPFIVRAQERNDDTVSACLWAHDLDDLEAVGSWASQWQGPISLLMATTSKPGSRAFSNLLHRLHDLSANPLSRLSVHLLRTDMPDQASSNSYLNLARIFASTSTVMLIPAGFSEKPPMPHSMVVSQLIRSSMQFPSIVVNGSNTKLTFSAVPSLTPVILPRDYPVWCTERFFLQTTRSSEWSACLWQLWLDSFGGFVDVGIQTRVANLTSSKISDGRLNARFQVETCDLMTRTIAAYSPKKQKDSKTKLQWLKETCAQNMAEKSPNGN